MKVLGLSLVAFVAFAVQAVPGAIRQEGGLIVFTTGRAATLIPTEVRAIRLASGRSSRVGVVPHPDVTLWAGWAPDGRSYAYVDDRGDLYVSRAGRGQRRVARRHGETDDPPVWSATGRALAFFGRDRGRLSVYVVRARGGGLRRVATRVADAPDRRRGGGLSWSPDGRRLAVVASRGGHYRLVVVELGTRRIRRVRTGRGRPTDPAWSPNGRTIAFRAQVPGERASVRTVDLASGALARVHAAGGVPLWSPDGRSLAIDEKHRLWVLQEGERRLVATHSGIATIPAWAPNSQRLVFGDRRDLVVVDAARRRTRRLTRESRRYEREVPPGWSAANRVVYVGYRRDPGDLDLHRVRSDGTGVDALTDNDVDEWAPAWSPDGRRVAYQRRAGGASSDVYVMNADGSAQRRIVPNGATPSWSPDGARLAFSRDDDIWTVGADGSNPVQLTSGAARDREPDWAPRGGQIAFARSTGAVADNSEIYAVGAGGGDARRITGESAQNVGCVVHLARDPAWSPDAQRLAYEREWFGSSPCGPTRGHKVEIYTIQADGTDRRLVTDGGYWNATADDGALSPTWSPDGTHVAFISSVSDMRADYDVWSRIATVPSSGGAFDLITPKSYRAHDPDWRP